MGRVYAIYYFGHFLMTLVGIILILFAWGKTRELLYKNEKTAKMLQKIKERLRIFIEKSTVEKKKDK